MFHRFQYIYSSRISRTTGQTETIGRIEAIAGTVKEFSVQAPNVGATGNFVFNLRKDGSAQLSGGDRITINTSAKRAVKTDADFDTITTASGDLLSFALDEMAQGGIQGEIIFNVVIDDGESSGGAVDSVNAQTGTVVLDADDISDSGTTHKFATAAEKTKLGFVSVTQAVDLDQIESDTATNNGKTSNATHTGEVTGATSLTVDKTAITNKTQVSADAADYLLISDTSDSGNLKKTLISSLPSVSGSSVDIQPFTSSGTWNKLSGAKLVQVFIVPPGGGAGSGRKGAAGSNRYGGGGGSAGAPVFFTFSAAQLGSTETVTIGLPGVGGAAVTANSTNGNNGTDGGDVTFGTWLTAKGGKAGNGGTTSAVAGGTGLTGFPAGTYDSVAAGNGTINTTGSPAASPKCAPGSGGGGSGLNASNNTANAGTGNSVGGINSTTSGLNNSGSTGGTGGTSGTPNGGNGTDAPDDALYGGGGGGGGRGNHTGDAGAGGNGGFPGGGGGGGGASTDSVGNSGKGGDGGAGWAIVITYF